MDAQELKKYIISNNKYSIILEYFKCHTFKTSNNWLRCSLENKKNNSIAINSETLQVKDFGNDDLSGDFYSFIMQLENINFSECIKLIHKILDIKYKGFNCKKHKKNTIDPLITFKRIRKKTLDVEEIKDLKNYEDSILDNFIPALYEDWKKDILEYTRKIFDIGFSYKNQRIIIPHRHYETGDLVGVIGRTVNELYGELDIPKYYPIIKYEKSNNIYGLFENYASIQKSGYIVVYEGEKSVLKRHARFDGTGISIGCHSISNAQVKILKSLNVEIVIAFDNDVSTYNILKNCDKFYPLSNITFIKDRWNILNEKDSPADANISNFNKLFKNRIKYNEKLHDKFIEMEERRINGKKN